MTDSYLHISTSSNTGAFLMPHGGDAASERSGVIHLHRFVRLFEAMMPEANLPLTQPVEYSEEYWQFLESLMLEACALSHDDRRDYDHSDSQY